MFCSQMQRMTKQFSDVLQQPMDEYEFSSTHQPASPIQENYVPFPQMFPVSENRDFRLAVDQISTQLESVSKQNLEILKQNTSISNQNVELLEQNKQLMDYIQQLSSTVPPRNQSSHPGTPQDTSTPVPWDTNRFTPVAVAYNSPVVHARAPGGSFGFQQPRVPSTAPQLPRPALESIETAVNDYKYISRLSLTQNLQNRINVMTIDVAKKCVFGVEMLRRSNTVTSGYKLKADKKESCTGFMMA